MTLLYDTDRWAERRRPFDALERRLVQLYLEQPTTEAAQALGALRYVVSFARLTQLRNAEGQDLEVAGPLQLHAQQIRDALEPVLDTSPDIWTPARFLPDLVARTRRVRSSLLERLPLDRESLEAEVTTRLLAVVSGGGGGAGYVYPGVYESLERGGLTPDLMVGTSIGALVSMFRARLRRYDPAPLVAAARRLAWGRVFRVLEIENRYGLPATLRLYLRDALGSLFHDADKERSLRLSELEIPMFTIATGITGDALKHDLNYYEHLLDDEVGKSGIRSGVRSGLKVIAILRDFLSQRSALKQVVIGRDPGTEHFDTLDAAGFSAAIPGVIHYDVLRDDPHMRSILDELYASQGITRLGEGGMVSNVPARVAWETVMGGRFGRRNVFVLALDCFAPNSRRLPWYPLQQIVRSANVDADRYFADLYVPFPRTLSPMNLVPPLRDALLAIKWGREEMEQFMPFVVEMMRPIPVLSDGE